MIADPVWSIGWAAWRKKRRPVSLHMSVVEFEPCKAQAVAHCSVSQGKCHMSIISSLKPQNKLLAERERERQIYFQVPHFLVGTLQPL